MEGCEAILAGADALLARCAVHGTRRVEVGMAHRGRLAMLSTLLNKPPGTLFAKMENAQSDYSCGRCHIPSRGDCHTDVHSGSLQHSQQNIQ